MKSIFSGILDENNYDTLCLELTEAESENDVIGILNNYDLWDDNKYWVDYGLDENNVAIIGNQTSNPEAALVEKFTNSIDAILIKEAKLRDIDPKSENAPQNIDEAMELFYGVKNKNIKNTSDEIFNKLKQQIYFVATGSEKRPSLAIIDKGEGQTPNMLPNTILSLRKTNKLEIKFVQGQFNQGGTAVLPFCGTNRLQLVISKRNPNIADKSDDSYDKWGFTIVRRNTTDLDSRNTRYEYLVIDSKIPAFKKDYLNLLPSTYPHSRKDKLKSGTYIKLYEYNIGVQSHINTSLNYNLSLRLPGAKIPISIHERRKWNFKTKTSRGSMTSLMYGHFYRFMNSSTQIEKGFPLVYAMDVDSQLLEVMIVCLKKDKKRSYKSNEGVLFTLNGQTQGIMKDTFFDRKAVGLGYLKESLMVFIDASKLDVKYREDLFMSNRENLRDIPFRRKIEKLLEIELNRNKALQKLQISRRNEIMKERVNNLDAMKKTMSKLIKNSPSLNILFNAGYDFIDSSNRGEKDEDNLFSFIGEKYPSYFNLTKEYTANSPKLCPINRTFRVTFKTDVEDLYFMRHDDKGIYTFEIENYAIKDYSLSLKQGKASFTCLLPEDISINELLNFNYIISNRNTKITTFEGTFSVLIEEAVTKKDTPIDDKRKKDKKPKPDNLNLPLIYEVNKDAWEEHNFTEEDALKIVPSQNGHDFYINIDNKYLNIERKNAKNDTLRLNEIFKGSIFLFALSMLENKYYEENLNEISQSAKAFARVSIPIINYGDTYKE